ncbi:MAG: zinc-finger domain-containing protein [Proteobacteria bacterium]|nr:zinc-finger domain-containing protein [Pseudomonadota bacterium]
MDEENIEIETMTVACDGGGGGLGHPNVYLHLDENTHEVVCPYCSRRFRLKAGAKAASGH